MLDSKVITLNFSDNKIPEFKEVRNKPYIYFGENDDYPDKLLELYNKSAKHNAIVSGKVNYIFGGGITSQDETAKAWSGKVNEYGESLNDIAKRAITDIEVFGGFYIQCIPTKAGEWLYYNLEFKKTRSSKDNSIFYYKKDWKDRNEKMEEYPAFDPAKKVTSVFYYAEYRPGLDTYPLPGYIGSLNYIESDIEVSKHTLTSAKKGWRPTKVINFFNGEPNEEAKREITRRLKEKTEGSEGETFLVVFNNDVSKKPQIDDLGTSELTKENFTNVDNLISSNIYAGHQITSPMLFGIKESGQLGGNTELRTAYEIFKNTYVHVKRQQILQPFNLLAKANGIQAPFDFKDTAPIGIIVTDQMVENALSKEEMRELLGYDAQEQVGDYALSKAINTLSPLVANKVIESMTPNEIRSIAGLPPKAEGEVITKDGVPLTPTQPQPVSPAGVVPEQQMVNENIKNLTGRQHQQMLRIVKQFTTGKLTEQQARLLLKTSLGLSDADVDILLGINDPAQEDEFAAFYDESQVAEMFSEVGEGRESFEVIQSKKVVFNSDKEAIEDELGVYQTFDLEEAAKDATIGKKVKDITKVVKKLPQIYIKYTYEVIPGEGPAIIPTTRPFCKRMVELSATRLWSRTDIEKISERLGYSVWDRRGGFWNNGGKVEKHCRHYWMRHIVIKKNNG